MKQNAYKWRTSGIDINGINNFSPWLAYCTKNVNYPEDKKILSKKCFEQLVEQK